LARAQVAACESWAGELTCPVEVTVKLNAPADNQPEDPPELPVEARLHNFNVAKTQDTLTLNGEYSTQALQQSVLSLANDSSQTLIDNTVVSGDAGRDTDSEAIARTARILPLLERGQISWNDGEFSVRGVATAEHEAAIRDYFAAASPPLGLGQITLQVAEETARCNESFANLLNASRIQFRTGSAVIDRRSHALLESLSRVAKECEGDLLIEGHTDNVGSEENNQKLSQRRADAVASALQELGIATNRLRATGYGESTPIGDNATAAGRASNRRIVIRIAELN
ncbi:MAG: OmpA family protein, partial [Pseudomonadota bacterium]